MTTVGTPVLTYDLQASIEDAVRQLRADERGRLTAGASLTGVEFSIAQRGPMGIMFGGYAKRLWGGDWQAGARMQVGW